MSIIRKNGKDVVLKEGKLLQKEEDNRAYLMSLSNYDLLFTYNVESGRYTGRGIQTQVLGGWESSTCQMRGHFLGHWLSAAAFHCSSHDDYEMKAKADKIVSELAICQEENGGKWVAAIPEKYLYWIAKGKNVWAPQYNIHKLFMGLVDMYKLLDNKQALEVADRFAEWFYEWSDTYTKEEFDNILDMETGGMLEIWCELYAITGKDMYRTLMERYYRSRLFDPILEGKDVLTNMHANTTIPEILGCARAYELFGDEKWLDIVKAYWKCAVTDRGYYATGGQTQGEVWTPKKLLKARIGDKNQEHCTVYNMMRVADFLFCQTGDPEYLQYMEYNLYNGIMAQTYWKGEDIEGNNPTGLLTYFLPFKAASKKSWAGARDSFFCCHGTMVQANAIFNRGIYYQDADKIYVGQYFDSQSEFTVGEAKVTLEQKQDYMNGMLQTSSVNDGFQSLQAGAAAYPLKPDFRKHIFTVHTQGSQELELSFRVPEWAKAEISVYVNDELQAQSAEVNTFINVRRTWADGDVVTVLLPIGLTFVTLPDDETMGAFRYGPEVLAGVCDKERVLKLRDADPTKELSVICGRQWGDFIVRYHTETQDPGFELLKLNEIGYEPYQVYFRTEIK